MQKLLVSIVLGCCFLQILIKEGILNKLSRKEMQPRMFFLVIKFYLEHAYFEPRFHAI